MLYQSPYAPNFPGQGNGQQQEPAPAAFLASSSASPAPTSSQPKEVPFPPGTVKLADGVFMGTPRYAEGEEAASEAFSREDVTVRDEEVEQGTRDSEYPEPSQGGYQLPPTHEFTDRVRTAPAVRPAPRPDPLRVADLQPSACLVEHPIGSKTYYILECLRCFAAFDGVPGAVIHFIHNPAHAELRNVITVDNVVEICGCRVVDATEKDYARMSSAGRAAAAREAPPAR